MRRGCGPLNQRRRNRDETGVDQSIGGKVGSHRINVAVSGVDPCGGGRISYYLAKKLEKSGIDVLIIEPRCLRYNCALCVGVMRPE